MQEIGKLCAQFVVLVGKYRYRLQDLVASAHIIAAPPVEYVDRYRVFIADGALSASTRIATSTRPGKRDDA